MMPPISLYRHAKNQKLLMTPFRENFQKLQFLTLNPHNSGCDTFFTILTPNVMQSLKKTSELSQRYFKKDHRRNMDRPQADQTQIMDKIDY